ncbi:MAG TPA: hypothetical protein VM144_18450 [Aestuariivirga sp.]|nr:hypothetical protein [Aestuariivirga sp.]
MAKTPNEKEIDRIRDAAVFRALNTPHKPHKPLKAKPAKKKGKK